MKNKLLWILTLLPIVVTCAVVPFMEDKVPAHYDIEGNIDRWGSKYESFILPITIILMTLFWLFILNKLHKNQRESSDEKIIKACQQNIKVVSMSAISTMILFNIIHYTFMYSAIIEVKNDMINMSIDINSVTCILVGISLIVIGNVMPKSRMNNIIGLRTTWSMKNDVTWAKSNRFAGASSVISGVLIVTQSIFIGGITSMLIMLIMLVIATIISIIYSYKVAQEYKD